MSLRMRSVVERPYLTSARNAGPAGARLAWTLNVNARNVNAREDHMAEMDAKKRNDLKDGDFAYVDKDGERHLPIHDESHVRNAMARWGQTSFDSKSAKEAARRKIVAAAKKHSIEIADDDKIASAGD